RRPPTAGARGARAGVVPPAPRHAGRHRAAGGRGRRRPARGGRPPRPRAPGARLESFALTALERTRQAVRELTRGLTRSSRMMQQLLPLLLGWLSASPDPDLGLMGVLRLGSRDT